MIAVDLNTVFLRNEGEAQPTLVLDSQTAFTARAGCCGIGLYNQPKFSLRRKLDSGVGANASFGRGRISWSKHHIYGTSELHLSLLEMKANLTMGLETPDLWTQVGRFISQIQNWRQM